MPNQTPDREQSAKAARNNAIWASHMAGATQAKLADAYNLSPITIHNIISGRRKSLPQETVDEIRDRSLAFLNDLGSDVMAIFHKPAPPITAGKDGDVVYDPDTGEVVRDYGTQLQAALVALRVLERMHKMVGIDAPRAIEVTTIASEATREQAEQAKTKFHLLMGGAGAQIEAG